MYNLVLEVNKQIETISINLKKGLETRENQSILHLNLFTSDDTEGSGSSSLFQENGSKHCI